MLMPAQVGKANAYCRSIRNVAKQAYAFRLLSEYLTGTHAERPNELGVIGAQAVEMRLRTILGNREA